MQITERQLIKQVNKIVACLTKCKNTREFLEDIHNIIAEMTYAQNFYVVLMSEQGDLHFPYFVDSVDSFSEDELNNLSLDDIHSSLTFFALTSNMECNFTRQDIEQMQEQQLINVVGSVPKQWMSFPLICDEDYLGAFVIQSYRRTDEYDQDAMDILKAISHVVSSALVAFRNQEELFYANTSLKSYQSKLEALIDIRTQTIESKKQKLEVEVEQRIRLQQELESKLLELQQQIEKNTALQKQLEHQATHDLLTGLANRRELNSILKRLAAKMVRSAYSCYLLFIDLDGFKQVNDTYSHDAGDMVLIEVGKRLKKMVRGYDLIARIGGDEFVVLLESLDDDRVVSDIAARIIKELSKTIDIGETKTQIGASIGIAHCCTEAEAEELIHNADKAMYQAKNSGKGQVAWFSRNML